MPKLLGWDKKRIAARVDELLELVSLDPAETRDRYPAQLSGGQRQRVGVARALAVDPPLMLMDEPFGAIDPINRERLQNEFLRLQKEIRKTIVFVTHDIDEAIKMGDKIAVLQKGGKLAAVRLPRRAPDVPRLEVRRGLRGRRPRAQAPGPAARRATSTCGRWPRCAWASPREARAKLSDADVKSHVLVVDDQDRPQGWLSDGALSGDGSTRTSCAGGAIVEMDDILRDALVRHPHRDARYGAVVDDQGAVRGVLSLEVISHFLHDAPTEARTGADLVGGRALMHARTLIAQSGCRRQPRGRRMRGRQRLLPRAGSRTTGTTTSRRSSSTST